MPTDIEAIVKNQMQNNLVYQLDASVQAGDIAAARKAAQQLADWQIQNKSPDAPTFTNGDIRKVLKEKAPWFGVDPRRSAKAVEFGKNMEPTAFKSAEEFANELIKSVEDEFGDEKTEEPEEVEDEEPEKRARKKTDAPSSNMSRAVPRRSSGPWTKLSDAPKEIATQIKASADKFTRNVTKEQRDRYIATALGTAYAADQRTRARK